MKKFRLGNEFNTKDSTINLNRNIRVQFRNSKLRQIEILGFSSKTQNWHKSWMWAYLVSWQFQIDLIEMCTLNRWRRWRRRHFPATVERFRWPVGFLKESNSNLRITHISNSIFPSFPSNILELLLDLLNGSGWYFCWLGYH